MWERYEARNSWPHQLFDKLDLIVSVVYPAGESLDIIRGPYLCGRKAGRSTPRRWNSLVLAVDHFNRAWDRGRTEAVLILLDRSFELLLKAIIVHRAGASAIREPGKQGMTLGFDHCLRKCLSDAKLKCLDEDDAVALQALNTLRDAAQHYMVEMAEDHLYVHAQSAVTLFGRLTGEIFGRSLVDDIPRRILPVCAKVPSGIESMFDIEFADIKRLVAPGSRRRLDAKARLRAMAILQASLDGKKSQPSDGELDRIVKRINKGEDWRAIFPGVSTLTIKPDGTGPGLSIRITRNKGEAVNLVKDGDADAAVVAVRRINDTDFYSLGLRAWLKSYAKARRTYCGLSGAKKSKRTRSFSRSSRSGRFRKSAIASRAMRCCGKGWLR